VRDVVENSGLTRTEKLLRELIALPSVNPAFLPPNDPHAGEQRVADFLAGVALRAGLDVDLQPVAPGRPNLFVRVTPSRGARQRVLLAPHLDTVGGNELSGRLFDPRISGGRLYGRGACDTKGSVAAMLIALIELANRSHRPAQTEIVFTGLVGEESGQDGSRALVQSGLQADLAIVGEPTRLQIVTAHKGDLWLRLETRGKEAHSALPELGRNAVHEMARVVDALQTDYADWLRRRRRHPLLGPATVSVGTIRGGRQPNIVPDRCAISLDRRTLPGESDGQARREIRQFLRARGLSASIRATETNPCLPLETNPDLPLVRQLLNTVGQAGPAGVHYFSDAGVLAAGGIPSVLFGPGDIAVAHTADEWISLRQLERAKDCVARFLQSLP
jgi:acetylornithine deacetylase/succinyl-diaminopimelate desuccinylase family protein